MKHTTLRTVVLSAVMAALVFVLTYTIKIPTATGYVHPGDTAVYLAAAMLPTPYALVAAGLGGALSDILGGYVSYAIPTFIIKALLTVAFVSQGERLVTRRNGVATAIGAVITVVGYYVTAALLLVLADANPVSSFFSAVPWASALSTIPENLMQAAVSAVAFLLIGRGLDRLGFKKRLSLG